MGGKGGDAPSAPAPAPSPFENSLSFIATDIYGKTAPLRDTYIQDWMNFLSPQQTLRRGAVPIRTPIYGNSTGTGGAGGAGMGGLFIDPNTGQIYGGDRVRQMITQGTPDQGQVITTPGSDKSTMTPPANTNGMYWLMPNNPGEAITELMPYQASGGAGGNGQNIIGYNESYRPEDYITTRFNPNSLPGYTPLYDISRRGLEAQYNTAANQLISNTPRGGTMNDALSRLALGRAESIGGLPGQISSGLINDMLNKSYGAAFNAPSQAISGLGAASQSYTATQNAMINAAMAQQAQEANSKSSGMGMLGMGLGSAVGSAFGSPGSGAAIGGGLGRK